MTRCPADAAHTVACMQQNADHTYAQIFGTAGWLINQVEQTVIDLLLLALIALTDLTLIVLVIWLGWVQIRDLRPCRWVRERSLIVYARG